MAKKDPQAGAPRAPRAPQGSYLSIALGDVAADVQKAVDAAKEAGFNLNAGQIRELIAADLKEYMAGDGYVEALVQAAIGEEARRRAQKLLELAGGPGLEAPERAEPPTEATGPAEGE